MSIKQILNSLDKSWERDGILLNLKKGLGTDEIVNEFLVKNERQIKELNSLLNSTLLLFTTHNTLEIFQSEKFCKIEISDFDVSRETGLIIRQGYTSNFLNALIKNLKKMMKEEN